MGFPFISLPPSSTMMSGPPLNLAAQGAAVRFGMEASTHAEDGSPGCGTDFAIVRGIVFRGTWCRMGRIVTCGSCSGTGTGWYRHVPES
jgi:hypothetical protein